MSTTDEKGRWEVKAYSENSSHVVRYRVFTKTGHFRALYVQDAQRLADYLNALESSLAAAEAERDKVRMEARKWESIHERMLDRRQQSKPWLVAQLAAAEARAKALQEELAELHASDDSMLKAVEDMRRNQGEALARAKAAEGALRTVKNHASAIVVNRREDGGECHDGGLCSCSEHEALRILLVANLALTPTDTAEEQS